MYLKLFQNIESSYPTIVRMEGNNEYTITIEEMQHSEYRFNLKQIILYIYFMFMLLIYVYVRKCTRGVIKKLKL